MGKKAEKIMDVQGADGKKHPIYGDDFYLPPRLPMF